MANTPSKKSSQDPSPVAHFEQYLTELEQLVHLLEKQDLSLEKSLSAYERGVFLYRNCHQALEQAQLRVNQLMDPENPQDATVFDPSIVST